MRISHAIPRSVPPRVASVDTARHQPWRDFNSSSTRHNCAAQSRRIRSPIRCSVQRCDARGDAPGQFGLERWRAQWAHHSVRPAEQHLGFHHWPEHQVIRASTDQSSTSESQKAAAGSMSAAASVQRAMVRNPRANIVVSGEEEVYAFRSVRSNVAVRAVRGGLWRSSYTGIFQTTPTRIEARSQTQVSQAVPKSTALPDLSRIVTNVTAKGRHRGRNTGVPCPVICDFASPLLSFSQVFRRRLRLRILLQTY